LLSETQVEPARDGKITTTEFQVQLVQIIASLMEPVVVAVVHSV
jgi:hypothetical protein